MAPMRAIVLAVAALTATPSPAKPLVTVKTIHYDVSGKDGATLLRSMDRKGPRHGFFGHAIAQTRYTIDWESTWKRAAGKCRVADARVKLDITYIFPRMPGDARGVLRTRWKSFLAGVERHEQTHGRIAREMAADIERSLKAMPPTRAASCALLDGKLKKRFRDVYERHEARQVAFDNAEHEDGGKVEAMIHALVKP